MQCAKRTLKDTLYVKFIVNPDLILEFLIYSVKYFRHSITNHLQKLPGTTPLRMKIKEAMHK